MKKHLTFILIPFLIPFYLLAQNSSSYSIIKNLSGRNGMVVSAHPLASEAGVAVLRRGGNAMDAAIAVQFALAVVYPQAGNLGGGGFLLARFSDGRLLALDFRETAPAEATPTMFLDTSGNPIPLLSLKGSLASGVPGTVDGIFASLPYARLPLKELVDPAINLAKRGFAITRREAENLNRNRENFLLYNRYPVAFVKDTPWKEGDILRQPELATTLEKIRDGGRDSFYCGSTAHAIEQVMKQNGGIITRQDLKNYRTVERKPDTFSYRGYKVITMPLPSSGSIILRQVLSVLSWYPIKNYGFASSATVHLIAEAERRSYADRARYLGDPDFIHVPIDLLIDPGYLKKRMESFSFAKATPSSSINYFLNDESTETTHFSVIDNEGNAVSVTTTLNGSYGNFMVVPGRGFLLNNEMDDFSLKPGFPNAYGALGGKANAIEPGKRMLSSMSPTILLSENKPFLILGSPGGTTIPTTVLQVIVNVIDFNMPLKDAVFAPRFHHQWMPDQIMMEKGFPSKTIDELKKKGHHISEARALGSVNAIIVHNDGTFEGVGDRRGDNSVASY